ncbi:MAG: hypothetical protein KME42_24155 [Tildeniella nuda ZEHNDER 1965/U140]|nr:hypothetical protein [Tildeniella nuda ZEHNDER 1965/U140]
MIRFRECSNLINSLKLKNLLEVFLASHRQQYFAVHDKYFSYFKERSPLPPISLGTASQEAAS